MKTKERIDIFMKLYANLHTHSTHSDGKFTPAEIARVAKE